MEETFIKRFEELRIEDVSSVGGKNASLGEMIKNLGKKGVKVPSGFSITAYAYKHTIEKEGIDTELSAYIPLKISKKDINDHLLKKVIDKLKEKSVILGDFYGGAKIEMKDKKITLDISDDAIRDLVANYIRRDFREKLFAK